MKLLVPNDRERVGAWVAQRITGESRWDGAYSALGLESDGELVAGVVVDQWVPEQRCQLHCAGEGRHWLTRTFLFEVFNYVFNQLRCKVILSPVAGGNIDSLRFIKHIGFTEVCRIPDADETGDLVLLSYYKDQCRWLGLAAR